MAAPLSRQLFLRIDAELRARPSTSLLTFLDPHLNEKRFSGQRILDEVSRRAALIEQKRIQPQQLIGVVVDSPADQLFAFLALLQSGCVPALLTPPNRKMNSSYYQKSVARVARELPFRALIGETSFDCDAPIWQAESYDGISTGADRPISASFVQLSSGTTGARKAVPVTLDQLLAQVERYTEAIELSPGDRIVNWIPLYHDMGLLTSVLIPLLCGIETILLHPLEWVARPVNLLCAISHYQGTLSWNPNFAYQFMAQRIRDADLEDISLSTVRALVNCSEPVTEASQLSFQSRFRSHGLKERVFFGCYAMAESTFAVTHGEPILDAVGPSVGEYAVRLPQVSVGQALPDIKIAVMRDDGTECSDREVGELVVSGPCVVSEYVGSITEAARAFDTHGYRTGDLGYRVGPDYYLCGRARDLIIIGGINMYPQDIEALVSEVVGVKPGRVVAFATFDEQLQTERAVILWEKESDSVDGQEVCQRVRARLFAELSLSHCELVQVSQGTIVKSSSGKHSRPENRMRWEEGRFQEQ